METLVVDLPSMDEAENARRHGVRIGRGAYREVFHLPGSRWAYKFELEGWTAGSGANQLEYHNFMNRRNELPEGVDFPEMEMLPNGVVAVEFVDGKMGKELHEWQEIGWDYKEVCLCESHRSPKCWKVAVKGIAMKDLHGGNVMVRKDGKILIIDIGEYGYDR